MSKPSLCVKCGFPRFDGDLLISWPHAEASALVSELRREIEALQAECAILYAGLGSRQHRVRPVEVDEGIAAYEKFANGVLGAGMPRDPAVVRSLVRFVLECAAHAE